MKRAQIYTYLQTGMTALCWAALIAAAVIKLNGGRWAYVMALDLLGVALGLGGMIAGSFVKRAMEANSPVARMRALLLQIQASESVSRPAPLVAVTIRPVPGKDCRYTLTIHNGTSDTLAKISLDHSWLLHPGKFGLDDTHMPHDIWVQPPVELDTLAPGADVSVEVEGYNPAAKYDGPKDTYVTVNATRVRNGIAFAGDENLRASVQMAW